MGRGRGKGRKLTGLSHEDQASGGEEVIVAYRRRGRPLKVLKDEVNKEKIEKMEEEEEDGDDARANIPPKESPSPGKGKKRKRHLEAKENSDSNLEENDTSARSSIEEPTTASGFRQQGRRRKGIPRRAAEAGVECK